MIDELAGALTQLQEPVPPPTFKTTVMARIAREADRQPVDAAASARRWHEGPAWLWTAAGLVIVLCASAYGWIEAGTLPDFTSPRTAGGLSFIPMEGPSTLVVGAGLLLYMAGLVAPLRRTTARSGVAHDALIEE
jgi:hypothetical protein